MKRLIYKLSLCLLVTLVLTLPSWATGKLGVLCLGNTGSTRQLIDTGQLPLYRTDPTNNLIPHYKQQNPNGIVYIGMGSGESVKYDQDPVQFAMNRWNNYLWPQLSKVSEAQKALIDYVAISPNMNEPHTVAQAQWWNDYSATLVPLVANAGYKPMVITSGVGGIPTDHSVLNALLPTFRIAHQHGGGWAYHGYTIHYTKDVATEIWYSLRYRQVYNFFSTHAPDLMTMPLVLHEAGVDYLGNPPQDGYAYRGTREQYADWLYWYDQEIMKDAYVVGAALFKIGGDRKSWSSFDLDPMVPWLINYWATGDVEWPRPSTVLGMCVLSENQMSEPVTQVSNSQMPIMYANVSELKPGGAVDLYKQSNPDGIVVLGMRSKLPYTTTADPTGEGNRRWNAIWKVLSTLTPQQRAMIDYLDPTPGAVVLDTAHKESFFAGYTKRLRERASEHGFKTIIATFDPETLPVNATDWQAIPNLEDIWQQSGKAGAAMIYQAGVPSYAKEPSAADAGLLKYRRMYAYQLKYKIWLLGVPVIVMVGDGNELKTIPDALGRRPKGSLGQFQDWLTWYDAQTTRDIDVLGVTLFKVGAADAYPASDLSGITDWFVDYIQEKAGAN